ncbi:MAG: hypothetical protein OEY09_01180 [Gammaproteobacteria bacterium]|nr:hypothetical protein [Gammaproteobacteria bacterium]
MGDEISKDHFEEKDYQLFRQKLDEEMVFVRNLFTSRSFDNRTQKLGYELELCLLDDDGAPAACNQQVLDIANNPLFTYELAKFNLEINGNAFEVTPELFERIDADLNALYREVEESASRCAAQAGLFGVLPSLQQKHLDSEKYMSELHRYHLLNQRLIEMRERPVHLEMHGEDDLLLDQNDVMLEALSTSLQTHLQIPFDEAVDSYHAALWTSMAVLAVGANSPLVLGKKCWQESRIAIFKQAVDTRNKQEVRDAVIPRVHFGRGYIESWLDLFEDNHYYSPVLPETKDCAIEELHHFNLHNGTIWRWVRPILGRVGDIYHLRLELRVTPSGPTIVDTMANMVFTVGLIEGLKQSPEDLTRIAFEVLDRDFYKVAREGLEARVNWCSGVTDSMKNILLKHAIPVAATGLEIMGIHAPEKWLDIIRARVSSGRTGADWILQFWENNKDMDALVKAYLSNARSNTPVHLWPYVS